MSIVWHDVTMEELLQDRSGYRVIYCKTYAEKKWFVDEWLSVPGHCTFSFNQNLPDHCLLVTCDGWIATVRESSCRKDLAFKNWYRITPDPSLTPVDDLI